MSLSVLTWKAPEAQVFEGLQDAIHVWRLHIKTDRSFAVFLNEEERARKDRYRFEADQDRFSISRGALRYFLGRYLKRDPLEIELTAGEKGKPCLKDEESGVSFNLSHSGEVVLIAFAQGASVGVDVEKIRDEFPDQKIARRFFSQGEAEYLSGLSAGERRNAFFSLWTLKEAFFKAKGEGLLLPLSRFEVLGIFTGSDSLIDLEGREDLTRWTVQTLPVPAAEHVSALAFEKGFPVEYFEAGGFEGSL